MLVEFRLDLDPGTEVFKKIKSIYSSNRTLDVETDKNQWTWSNKSINQWTKREINQSTEKSHAKRLESSITPLKIETHHKLRGKALVGEISAGAVIRRIPRWFPSRWCADFRDHAAKRLRDAEVTRKTMTADWTVVDPLRIHWLCRRDCAVSSLISEIQIIRMREAWKGDGKSLCSGCWWIKEKKQNKLETKQNSRKSGTCTHDCVVLASDRLIDSSVTICLT